MTDDEILSTVPTCGGTVLYDKAAVKAAIRTARKPPHGSVDAYIVVWFWGQKDIIGSVTIDRVYFTRDAADKRCERMQKRHNWIWRVIPATLDIGTVREQIRADLTARGINTRIK